jgi:hypothetical protein
MKWLLKKWILFHLSAFLMAFSLAFSSCYKGSNITLEQRPVIPYDPAKPVSVQGFSPESGGVSTQMLITGTNFGTDTSQIRVLVNGKQAPVISSDGTRILALVPSRAGTGEVKVLIGPSANRQEVIAPQTFTYYFRPTVGTLAGFKNANNQTAIIDGAINVAQFEQPYWLLLDQHKNIYLLEEYRALRFIDSARTYVKTLFRTGNGVGRPRTLAFNPTWDTLYLTNDQWDETGISTVVLTSASGFTRWNALIYNSTTNGGDAQPQTGDYFYNRYKQGQIFQWDRATRTSRELFRIGDNDWEFNIQFAPSGDFAYICVINRHYLLKATYNRQTRTLESPVHFVGQRSTAGYRDGVGTSALFREPHQGAFDENDNFYVCDRGNHCIRKITPDGVVTTFAGRPNQAGYTDGALRDAQFNWPMGIVYDKSAGTFYVADHDNARIRTITTE